jgi:hypothetical protein
LITVNVSTLFSAVGLVPNAAVTPVGSPEAERVTLELNPFLTITVTVSVPLFPGVTVSEAADALNVKLGAGFTVITMEAFAVL